MVPLLSTIHVHTFFCTGLVSKVFPSERLMEEAVKMAKSISEYSLPVTLLAKEAVLAAENLNLEQGLLFEKRLFHGSFALVSIFLNIIRSILILPIYLG